MSYPDATKLPRPLYCYSEDSKVTSADKHRGLLQYGPLKLARIREPKCLFIFQERERDAANALFLSLKNGIGAFTGTKKVIGISIERDNVEALRIPSQYSFDSQNIGKAIEERLRNGPRPDFAFILHGRQTTLVGDDPYHFTKAALIKHGIPSQYISLELLKNPSFKYAIANIALSILVKLGGVPWSILVRRNKPTLVFGIGKVEAQRQVRATKRQLIGYATCVLSNGLYLETNFFPPAESYTTFLENLKVGLSTVLQQMAEKYGSSPPNGIDRISIHVSQLEKRDTVKAVTEVTKQFTIGGAASIPIEVIKINNNSDFMVFDLDDPGMVSEEGSAITLSNQHALLVTEGRKEKAVWRGRKPVTLELQRTYASSPSLTLKSTIEDAFSLSSVNWRGFNAVTQPVSLQYAKLLADQIAKVMTVEPDICQYIEEHKALSSVPWFI